ncbi:hexokinase type 2-like [Dendroctonus ponderosae]|uniref:hexokinase type 2 n=1 Tax=Dendroctonus ponderosae TaxID=77166 RepID=UPI002034D1E4|nr:hexokinase type 2 [Dendroctonus ponderosae]XP_048518716.1 hexokinase type 2-like [Dendroctonus ponderosae]KAH1004870.1 hypothetical protein HUJ05_005638 [Dendroctonus ponderosae]KAH1004986.1 hypothetical protein HUJ05_005745 [Dendroctonus ponderosae]
MACRSKICNPIATIRVEDLLDPLVSAAVKERMQDMVLTNETLRKEMQLFRENIERGLKKATHEDAVIKCFPTYVQDLPDGTEVGKFLALDLGGTNFRTLLVDLDANKCEMQSKVFAVPHEVMTGSGVALFDHIAACLAEFAQEYGVQAENLPLGFTFSFPVTQVGLCSGILRRWTKGFNCEDVVGQDVVQWLIEAIQRRNDVEIDVCAVLNDTTGTLMSCAWKNPNCRIGLIIGTGSNGCYYETQTNAELFNEPDMGTGKVIINLEMGAFGEDGALDFIRTEEDRMVDENSINPGGQIHEKCVSGMYLGELVRLRALALVKEGLLFDTTAATALETSNAFSCEMMSQVESEPVETQETTKEILGSLGIENASKEDMLNFRYICQTVSRRSAHLIGASMCVLIEKMQEPYVVVGIDGSVYKNHPHFRRIMTEKMNELIAPGYKFQLMLSEDGSGRGAALVAAVAARKKNELGI